MASNELLGHYLNDHLAGSVTGLNLAEQIETENAGTPLGQSMGELVADIGADKATLEHLMEQLGVDKSSVKQTSGWVAEKLSRLRFNDRVTGSEALSRLMEMEMLSVGIEGKLGLWRALQAVAGSGAHPGQLGKGGQPGDVVDLDRLIHRAQDQLEKLESHRLEAAIAAFEER
ncbi:MAG: hypothetical protein H0T70_03635 [Acidimicrobiia bacterium]|nr:hypothetical protein [Acidimicrobiia bacterium]